MTFAVEVSHLSKVYKEKEKKALNDVSFTIKKGDFFGLLGPNGAGKSTIISIMGGISLATEGSCRIMGFDVIKEYQQARMSVGIVPQEIVYDPFLKVRETLEIQSGYYGLKKNKEHIDFLLESLSLTDKSDSGMRTLSGGMKRRVMVAQALVHNPPVIVLDEPTAGVDVDLRQSLWDLIKKLNSDGRTVLLTTHYLQEAETLCSNIAFLRKGELIKIAKKEELLASSTATKGIQVNLTTSSRLDEKDFQDVSMRLEKKECDYIFSLPTANDLEEILSRIKKQGIYVQGISISPPSLEEIFIQLMKS